MPVINPFADQIRCGHYCLYIARNSQSPGNWHVGEAEINLPHLARQRRIVFLWLYLYLAGLETLVLTHRPSSFF